MLTAPAFAAFEDLFLAASTDLERTRPAARDGDGLRALPDVAYQADPIGWARDILGIPEHTLRWSLNPGYGHHVWDGTADPLARIAEEIAAGRNVGVESGTGTGKTFLGGWLCAWFLLCHPNAIVVTTAPKEDQLTLHLWKELGNWVPQLRRTYPGITKAHLRLRLRAAADGGTIADDEDWSKESWAIIGWACGVDAQTSARGGQGAASRAKGFHAEHLLIITEETQGIHPAVMTSLRNTCTGDHNLQLAFGNPLFEMDPLHQFCERKDVVHVRVSALDHPNVVLGREVIPGAAGRRSIQARRDDYGEDSPIFKAQVRGISPKQAANALIRREWVEAAIARYHDEALRVGGMAKGVDVAQSEAGDLASIATGQGACLLEVNAFPCDNATDLGTRVWLEMQRDKVRPECVGVDSVGIGAATVNELNRELQRARQRASVQSLNGGARPMSKAQRAPDGSTYDWAPDENAFLNLRSQMWWQLREDLRLGAIALPPDEVMTRELLMPTFTDEKGRGTVVESKDAIRKRMGGRSPDRADSVVYWNWVRERRALPVAPGPSVEEEARRERRDPAVILAERTPRDQVARYREDVSYRESTFAMFGD